MQRRKFLILTGTILGVATIAWFSLLPENCMGEFSPEMQANAEAWLDKLDQTDDDSLSHVIHDSQQAFSNDAPYITEFPELTSPLDDFLQSTPYATLAELESKLKNKPLPDIAKNPILPNIPALPLCYRKQLTQKIMDVATHRRTDVHYISYFLIWLSEEKAIAETILPTLEKTLLPIERKNEIRTNIALKHSALVSAVLPFLIDQYVNPKESERRRGSELLHRLWFEGILPSQTALSLYTKTAQTNIPSITQSSLVDMTRLAIHDPSLLEGVKKYIGSTSSPNKDSFLKILSFYETNASKELLGELVTFNGKEKDDRLASSQILIEILVNKPQFITALHPLLSSYLADRNFLVVQSITHGLLAVGYKRPQTWPSLIPVLQDAYLISNSTNTLTHQNVTPAICMMAKQDNQAKQLVLGTFSTLPRKKYSDTDVSEVLECALKSPNQEKASSMPSAAKQRLEKIKEERENGQTILSNIAKGTTAHQTKEELITQFSGVDEFTKQQLLRRIIALSLQDNSESQIVSFLERVVKSENQNIRASLFGYLSACINLFPKSATDFYPVFMEGIRNADAKEQAISHLLPLLDALPGKTDEILEYTLNYGPAPNDWDDLQAGLNIFDLVATADEDRFISYLTNRLNKGSVPAIAVLSSVILNNPAAENALRQSTFQHWYIGEILYLKDAIDVRDEKKIKDAFISIYTRSDPYIEGKEGFSIATGRLLVILAKDYPQLPKELASHFARLYSQQPKIAFQGLWSIAYAYPPAALEIMTNVKEDRPKGIYPSQALEQIALASPEAKPFLWHSAMLAIKNEKNEMTRENIFTFLNNTFVINDKIWLGRLADVPTVLVSDFIDAKNFLFWSLACQINRDDGNPFLHRFLETTSSPQAKEFIEAAIQKGEAMNIDQAVPFNPAVPVECKAAISMLHDDDPQKALEALGQAFPTDHLVWKTVPHHDSTGK